jgi:anti-sigma regulatory factor (Ser/Thr protein kinase)
VTTWGLDPIRIDAVLITSELCANAVLHARTDLQVRLQSDGLCLRIEVRDGSSRMPSSVPVRNDRTGGRGLAIVAALATSWNAHVDGTGKVVWAEIDLPHLAGTGDGLRPGDFVR